MSLFGTTRARTRSTCGALAFGLLFASAWHPSSARTQSTDAGPGAPLDGWWQLAVRESEARSRIEQAIRTATERLPPFVDGMVARALREHTPLPLAFHIAATASRVAVRFDGNSFETPAGHPRVVPLPSPGRGTMEIVQLYRGGNLQQVFTTAEGRRWNTFRLSADGSVLDLDVVIQSNRLSAEARFSIPYRRAQARPSKSPAPASRGAFAVAAP